MATNGQSFALPGTGADVLRKTLHAYILTGGKDVSGPDVAQRAGIRREDVARNSKFLTSVGVMTGGMKKSLTAKGQKLALAISHDDTGAVQGAWRELIADSPGLKAILDMIKVQNGIPKTNLPSRIASHLNIPGGQHKTGLNTLVDILCDAGAIAEEDDKFVVAGEAAPPSHKSEAKLDAPPAAPAASAVSPAAAPASGAAPIVPIHINIELHLPSSAEQGVYDAIFRSIRQNLMEPADGVSGAS